MNIYDFFESPDIAEHCRSMGHEFSPLDMAVIIDRSNKSMRERHAAYRELIESCPDMPIHKSLHYDRIESLHGFLRETIAWEGGKNVDFHTSGEGILYIISESQRANRDLSASLSSDVADGCCYSTFEKAWTAICDGISGEESPGSVATITKVSIDESKYVRADISFDGEVIDLWSNGGAWYDGRPGNLNDIFIHLPLPFERGDLVTTDDGKPRVLDNIPHWYEGEKYSYEDFVSGRRGDGWDMLGHYFFIGEDGKLIRDHGISDLHLLRYYDGELQGQERFLQYLGEYIKSNDENIDWLINLFLKFKAEADYKE